MLKAIKIFEDDSCAASDTSHGILCLPNMHFQFTAYDVNNNPIDMKSDKAQIDVTARSGNLYRRIRAEKTVSPSSLESVFDSVLYAGNGANDQANTRRDICKSMVVRSNNSLAPATGVVPCN